MKCQIKELSQFSGTGATIYSVIIGDNEVTLFEQFVTDNISNYQKEIKNIAERLRSIGMKYGARAHFFKHNEGKGGDGVCALYDDPGSKLRLYCIRYGNDIVLLGGGGYKAKNIRAWQEDENLSHQAQTMIALSKILTEQIKSGELSFSKDGLHFTGKLNALDNE